VGVFIRALILQPELRGLQRVFLYAMVIASVFYAFDYGTTGVLRALDHVAVPAVPSTFLPDFHIFPIGVILLAIWRTVLAFTLWGFLFYMIVIKRGKIDG
jgi:hypothetical protein